MDFCIALDEGTGCIIFRGMRRITLSADEALIDSARAAARAQSTTLNQLFRDWLSTLASQTDRDKRSADLIDRLEYARSGGPFSRREMNERQ